MKKYNILQTNPKKKYQGSHYAITGRGGFEINSTNEIQLKPILQFGKYDLTNTLQIVMNKEIFNSKIGVFDGTLLSFSLDNIRLEPNDFILEEKQIVSMGSLETLYIDFKKYIYDYFKMSYIVNMFNENTSHIFDEEELCKLIRENHFSGYIEIIGINEIFKNLMEYNICGNRNDGVELKDGFISGDILYIPEGLSIMLSIDCGLKQTYKYDISIRMI